MNLSGKYYTRVVRNGTFYIKEHLLKGKGIYFLLLTILLTFTYTGHSAVYYVSASGNDSNSGISPDQPWKSLAKVNSFIPAPGDQILFNRGDEWVG
uniref:hypothetical protein n=1 Tax=Mariniphaga sediminis TaxID=1628158 RepID=UPI00356277A1